MNTLEIINNRSSYRGKYKAVPVPREDLTAIMQAGLRAPSGCNQQTTSLIAVDDKGLLNQLKEILPSALSTAPACICVLTQRLTAYKGMCFAVQDYSAAIENMLIAIEALGYKSCWYEGYLTDEEGNGRKMARILGVPEEYELVCLLPVGVPETEIGRTGRKPFEERAWFNGFRNN